MGSGEDLRPGHGSCAHCGRTGANLGRALQACNSCWRVDYCDRECAEAHRAVHCRKREGAGRAPGPPTTCELLQHTSLMEEEEQRVDDPHGNAAARARRHPAASAEKQKKRKKRRVVVDQGEEEEKAKPKGPSPRRLRSRK